jgi:hypothetical protein
MLYHAEKLKLAKTIKFLLQSSNDNGYTTLYLHVKLHEFERQVLHNSPDTNHSEKCFKQTLYKKIKHTLYAARYGLKV